MRKEEMMTREAVDGWVMKKIQKLASNAIVLENLAQESIKELGLDSVELIGLMADFETKFDCKIITEQFIELESLSDLKKFMYKAAVRS